MRTPKTIKDCIDIDYRRDGFSTACVTGPFDISYEILQFCGYDLITIDESITLRMEKGLSHSFSNKGHLVDGAVLSLPNGKKYLTKKFLSPEYIKEITHSHKEGQSYTLDKTEISSFLKNAIRIPDEKIIPFSNFESNKFTNMLFGWIAGEYGKALSKKGIEGMLIVTEDAKDLPILSPIWLGGAGEYSSLYCCSRNTHQPTTVRGIIRKGKPFSEM